jgi:hypothetical protein
MQRREVGSGLRGFPPESALAIALVGYHANPIKHSVTEMATTKAAMGYAVSGLGGRWAARGKLWHCSQDDTLLSDSNRQWCCFHSSLS